MADTFYTIVRGFQEGKNLTTAQKSSSLFSEEPVVMGRVLRRGGPPMRISADQYRLNEAKILQLEKAGAIKVVRPLDAAPLAPLTPEEIKAQQEAEAAEKAKQEADLAAVVAADKAAAEEMEKLAAENAAKAAAEAPPATEPVVETPPTPAPAPEAAPEVAPQAPVAPAPAKHSKKK